MEHNGHRPHPGFDLGFPEMVALLFVNVYYAQMVTQRMECCLGHEYLCLVIINTVTSSVISATHLELAQHMERPLSASSPPVQKHPTHSMKYGTASQTHRSRLLLPILPPSPLHQHSHHHTSPQQSQSRTPHLVRQTRIIGFYTKGIWGNSRGS